MSKYHRSPVQTTPFFHRSAKMPSPRRIKIFGVLIFVFVVTILMWSSSTRQSQGLESSGDFYAKTVNALDKDNARTGGEKSKAQVKVRAGAESSEDDEEVSKAMAQRLKDAAQEAKDKANAKAPKPDPPSAVVGKGSAAEGAREEKVVVAGRKKFVAEGAAQEVVQEEAVETEEDRAVHSELTAILKKSPIIIFSKSYCPHSRRAKGILLEKYVIEPKPYVVELDKHELGLALQARLADLTGRRTVPNVLINGVSIGGGDEIAELDVRRQLIDKINDLGGNKMITVKERPVNTPGPAAEAHGLR